LKRFGDRRNRQRLVAQNPENAVRQGVP
jgi:hypothetical protein